MLGLLNSYVLGELAAQRELEARRSARYAVRRQRNGPRRVRTITNTTWGLGHHRPVAGH